MNAPPRHSHPLEGSGLAGSFLRERWPLLVALWVAISSNAAIIAVLWPKAQAVDFAVFWRAVQALHPYAVNEQPFVYPPTALLWFEPLRLVEVWPGYLIWNTGSILLFCAAANWLYGRRATALAVIFARRGRRIDPGPDLAPGERRLVRGLRLAVPGRPRRAARRAADLQAAARRDGPAVSAGAARLGGAGGNGRNRSVRRRCHHRDIRSGDLVGLAQRASDVPADRRGPRAVDVGGLAGGVRHKSRHAATAGAGARLPCRSADRRPVRVAR